MPLGHERELSTVNQDDTADLYAYAYDENNLVVSASAIDTVDFTIQKPDGTRTTIAGTVEADGAGHLIYTDTSDLGEYVAVARFALVGTEVRSTRLDFTVVDPFNPPDPTPTDIIEDFTWTLLEDCFDSDDGGPWLRDMTLAYFNKAKVPYFVQFALLDINVTQPPTNLTMVDFTLENNDGTPNPSLPILAYGTLIHIIHHLMRSYVEQSTPMGAEVVYEDRRDYLQRWQSILQMMEPEYQRMLILWKRQFLHLGRSALLVSSKAGRLYGSNFRLRNAGRGFGY